MNQKRELGPIEINIDYLQSINYAMLLNGDKVVNNLTIKNISDTSLCDIHIYFNGSYFSNEEVHFDYLASGETIRVTEFVVMPELARLSMLNEAIFTELQISIKAGIDELASFRFPLTLQAWNQWTASSISYKDIASFVMPNHPYVISIIEKATDILRKGSNYSSFCGYNVPDYGDVVEQIRAIWSALLGENLKYLTINPNFTDSGQRIMTPDLLFRNHHGNCMDLSLLLCSCFERIGLAPCLVFIPDHVFVGIWINPNDCIIQDSFTLTEIDIKTYALGDNPSLMLIESTAMCIGLELDEAVMSIISMLSDTPIKLAIDVINARKCGARSIPIDITSMNIHEDNTIKGCYLESADSNRRKGWERKLLDLTLRNVMLNLKTCKTIVPIWEHDTATVVNSIKCNQLAELIGNFGKDNLEQLKSLYRAARTALEENGANSLFVSLGSLRWFDSDDPRPHIAPLLFIPVSIVRKKAMTYEVRLREDDAMVNVTLIEMLRQMFGVSFPELTILPEASDGFPDWQKIFDIFEAHIVEINKRQPDGRKWELPIQSYIGIFSFTKYLMWHDIHYHPDVIERHQVLRGFIENRYKPNFDITLENAQSIETGFPADLMLPLDYDSSQLEAVKGSHIGQSFVLHGPPGTGKSQTITNIIADAIYSGKRVLFVAEKKAALDVVRSRLNSIGLEPYCMEMHSNKADKHSFFDQVHGSRIFDIGTRKNTEISLNDYKSAAKVLRSAQRYLKSITDAIHVKREYGQSLYDYINCLLESGYNELMLSYTDISHLTPSHINELCTKYRSLDLVAQILGFHPGESDLVGLYPRENTAHNQSEVIRTLERLPVSIAKARKKAATFLNRLLFKQTPEEILSNDVLWQQLNELAIIDKNISCEINTFERYVKQWYGANNELRRWYHFSENVADIARYNLPKALNYYLHGREGHHTADAIYTGYFRTQALYLLNNDNRLRNFSGLLHEDKISHYCSYNNEFQNLQKVELIRQIEQFITNSVLTPEQEKQLAVLTRRMQTCGRGVALRKIITDSANILGIIFPCMLMSPLSVAQYLEMKPDQFDIVIFDEASQMETQDAIGTIARGRSIVVVGDPLQLPPTRFFMAQSSTGEEIEESEDSDSILEDCIALGLPSRYLSRHYRSRHESLIAFSNDHFYDNHLLTFPSHNDTEKKVTFINPGGVYDYGKTRTNRIEAETVVKYILEILDNAENAPSLGIVSFSKAQSNLIEDILNSKLQRNKVAQKKLDDAHEPLFIKNLENVQGDERDIIILCIGYGPDKYGNVSLNFGPLNKSGGERRLNVAISRAREKMIVFSSLLPQHIPSQGIATGVMALRSFLAYAIEGVLNTEYNAQYRKEIIVEDIAKKLRNEGLKVVTKIGRSAFKIDIAIVDQQNNDNYRLGIIIDGLDYYKLPTVRDREITVPSVLRSLGWHLHRVWIIDWVENPDAVICRILKVLSEQ